MKKIRSFTLGQLQHIVDSHAELPVGNYVTARLAVARSLDSSVVQSQFSHEPVQLHERRIMLLRRGWLRPVVNLVNECFSEGELVFLGTDCVVQFREYSPDLQGYGLSMSNELFSQALQGHIPPAFDGHLRSFHFPLTGSEMERFDAMHRLLYDMCRAGESEAVCHHLLAAILWYVDSLCKKREQEGGQASSREQRLFADFIERYADEILSSVFFTLADRFRNFRCFAQTTADMTVFVADNYQSRKAHVTSALNDLRNAFDGYYFIFELHLT